MPKGKTGTVTGAPLNSKSRNKKGGLTGSKRFEEETSVGDRARDLAQKAGTSLSSAPQVISNAANTATSAAALTGQVVNNVGQALATVGGATGFQNGYASTELSKHSTEAYGGISVPEQDFKGLIPQDLLHPSISLKATEEELQTGLAEYAAGTRAQQLLQAGYKYIEEVGKTKQGYHKAQGSIVKAATQEVKLKQEVVKFDRANVNLEIEKTGLERDNEKLKQEQIQRFGDRPFMPRGFLGEPSPRISDSRQPGFAWLGHRARFAIATRPNS